MRCPALVALLWLAVAVPLAAQDRGPTIRRGTWGGEICFNCGIALLRFRDSTSAWIFGFNGQYAQNSSTFTPNAAPAQTDNQATLSFTVSAGLRFYRVTSTPARPFISVSAMAGGNISPDEQGNSYGAAADMGTAYFFTPHVSLGVSGRLTAVESLTRSSSGGGRYRARAFVARLNGANLLASVYF